MHSFGSLAVAALATAHHAAAWGNLGHRTVAYLAQKYVTQDNAALLGQILENGDWSDAAVWADEVKRQRPYSAEWHYIDAQDQPPQQCAVSYPQDCTNSEHTKGCIIDAITNQTSLFLDPNTDAETRQDALKYIFHFLGDLHQPLHIEDAYRGGNEITPVCFGKACAHNNLHSVWDKDIPHHICGLSHSAHGDEEKEAAVEWAEKLFNGNQERQATTMGECADIQFPSKCTLAWAGEANTYVCSAALKRSVDWLKSHDLSQEYYQETAPVVQYLIGMAGLRLGGYLNALAAASQGGSSMPDSQHIIGSAEL